MTLLENISKHFREVYFGGNWTCSNLKETLLDITWQEATTQVYSLNTIATLVYHINYYTDAVLKVLNGEPLNAKDADSFKVPPIQSQQEWENLCNKTFTDAEKFSAQITQLPEAKLWEIFADEKYGNYYRNLHGNIEHTHYHLGQIAILKKIIQQKQ